jgi:hypothetical protein
MADTTLTGTLSTTFVDKPDDVLSAKTYADAAANAANAASTSENNAATSEANSKKSETAAKTSETNAASSATAAAQSEANVSTYKDQTKSYAYSAITTVATLTYATDAEATAGTATDRMISPATLKAVVDAAVKEAKLDAHPVGSYYFSDDSTSPTDLFGGTWEALPAGYTLIAQGAGSDSFGSFTYTAGQKYGERKHQLTTDELPHLEGRFPASVTSGYQSDTTGIVSGVDGFTKSTWASDSNTWGFNIAFGGNQPHENIPPTIASYGWKRTA